MKYLLDTHAFLWTLLDDEQLSKKAAKVIQKPDNDIYVSVITFWEISLKHAIGKLELTGISPDELPQKAKETGIQTLKLTAKEAASFHRLPKLKHKDPFDRIIIWQAINANLNLISKDKEIEKYRRHGLKTFW